MKNKKFLITGANGQLAGEFQAVLKERDIEFAALARDQLDITDFKQTEEVIDKLKPDVILNCAAYNLVDKAEDEPDKAFLVNAKAVENLAKICKERKIFLVHYSTDYVFDGKKQDLYTEEDEPNPLGVYGKSKLEGEQAALKILDDCLVFRVSWVIGKGQQNFLYKLTQWAKTQPQLKVSFDEVSIPTSAENIVNVTLQALDKGLKGLYHLTNTGHVSRYDFAKYFAEKMNLTNEIISVPSSSFKTKAQRPSFSALSNEKISKALSITLPSWKQSVNSYLAK